MSSLAALLRRAIARLLAFLHSSAAGGPALFVAALVALVLANSGTGEGYRLLTDIVAHLDGANPQVGARMLGPLRQWRRFAEPQRGQMQAALEDLAGRIKSRDIYEVVSKSLAG